MEKFAIQKLFVNTIKIEVKRSVRMDTNLEKALAISSEPQLSRAVYPLTQS